jgi:hypothetical protein
VTRGDADAGVRGELEALAQEAREAGLLIALPRIQAALA